MFADLKKFMHLAIDQAKFAYDQNEVPVGAAIIERESKLVISQAHNLNKSMHNPTYHAEILAINKACVKLNRENLSGYDIYVTLEPCAMCAAAISHSRINRVFFGAYDSKFGAMGSSINIFYNSSYYRPQIFGGLFEDASKELLKNFFRKIRKNNI